MASTISTINQSLVDDRVVSALKYVLPMLSTFSYGLSSTGKIQNDVVYVPIATDPTAQSKTAGTGVTANGTVAGSTVTLSNFYGAGWDATEGSIAGNLFANYWADKAAGAVYSLAKQVIDAALAVITAANFSTKHSVAVADFGSNDMAELWRLAEVTILQRERSLGLNAAFAAQLLGNTNVGLIYSNTGNNFMMTGVMPQILGMKTWAYGAFPANSESLGGAVIGRAGILVGAAPPEPLAAAGEGNIVDRRIITDPESGLSVLYTSWMDGGGTMRGECSILYGVAKGQSNSIVRLVSA